MPTQKVDTVSKECQLAFVSTSLTPPLSCWHVDFFHEKHGIKDKSLFDLCAQNDRQYRHDDLACTNDLCDLESANESMINRRRSVRGTLISVHYQFLVTPVLVWYSCSLTQQITVIITYICDILYKISLYMNDIKIIPI